MSKPEIGKMDPKSILAWLREREIKRVQEYLSGNPKRRKESYIRYIMIALIESECNFRRTGIELGRIDYGYYKQTKRRRQLKKKKEAKR